MLLEEDGALGRTAQQNQDEKQARAALSPSGPFHLCFPLRARDGLLSPPLPLHFMCAEVHCFWQVWLFVCSRACLESYLVAQFCPLQRRESLMAMWDALDHALLALNDTLRVMHYF